MIRNKKILVVGAGGFIGGHLVNKLIKDGNIIIAADIKPREHWFQEFEKAKNYYSIDMKEIKNCRKVVKNVDYVFIDPTFKDLMMVFAISSVGAISSYMGLLIVKENADSSMKGVITSTGAVLAGILARATFYKPVRIDISGETKT